MRRRTFLKAAGATAAGAAAAVGGAVVVELPAFDRVTPFGHQVERSASATSQHRTRLGARQVLWSVETAQPRIALTFDDGPDPRFTPRVLEALGAAGVHATFNVVGVNVVRHQALAARIVAEGHELGNHTWQHEDLAYATREQVGRELRRAKDAVEQVTQTPLRLFRPPRGTVNGYTLRVAAELGYDIVLWSLSRGPDTHTSAQVGRYLVDEAGPGDIVGLHDGTGYAGAHDPGSSMGRALAARREGEVRVLPSVLDGWAGRGLDVGTVGELVALDRA